MLRRRRGRGETATTDLVPDVVTGVARVDRRTKRLTKRLRPGDVAVIDHLDLDRVSAEALVARRPAAVVNASASTSGRFPNLGPRVIVAAGIPLVDAAGPEVMSALAEGSDVRVEGGAVLARGRTGERVVARGEELTPESVEVAVQAARAGMSAQLQSFAADTADHLQREGARVQVADDRLLLNGAPVATGRRLTAEAVAADMEAARAGLSLQLEAFAANTMEFLRRERDLLLDGVGVPDIRTVLEGRHALVVVRGYHYKDDLVTLRSYVREYRPVLIGVDGGADAILEAGWKPDLIVGDMDSVSDAALRSGAEIVVHAYRDGRAPGLERVRQLGIEAVVFPATGTSEDVAMLLADDKGATLIAAVGTHVTLVEFLDKGRSGMASTFLTRLRVGGKLVDAKGVSRLYRSRISNSQVLLLIAAGVLALVAALAVTPTGQAILAVTAARLEDLWAMVLGLLPGVGP